MIDYANNGTKIPPFNGKVETTENGNIRTTSIIVLGNEEEVRGRANSTSGPLYRRPGNSALNEWSSSEKKIKNSFFRQIIAVIRMATIATLEMCLFF